MISGRRLRIAAIALATLLGAPLACAFAISDPDGKDAARSLNRTERWAITSTADGLDYTIHDSVCADLRFVDGSTCADIKAAIRSTFGLWSAGHAYLRFQDTSAAHPILNRRGETGVFEFGVASMGAVMRNGLNWSDSLTYEKVGVTRTVSRLAPGNAGHSIFEAMIAINDKLCFYLDFAKIDWNAQKSCAAWEEGAPANAFEFRAVMAHEIGHALGLSHPDLEPGVNFDNDTVRDNPVVMDCRNPMAGLKPSANVALYSVMNRSFDYPIERGLSNDDLAGRNFLYPACETQPAAFDASPRSPFMAIVAVTDEMGLETVATAVSSWDPVISVRRAMDNCLAKHTPELCRYAGGYRTPIVVASRVDLSAGPKKPPVRAKTLVIGTGDSEAEATDAMRKTCDSADGLAFCIPIGTFSPMKDPPPWLTLPGVTPPSPSP